MKALVLWAALAHPGRIFERLFPEFGDREVFDMHGWDVGRAFLEDARTLHPLEEIKRYAGRALIVHGSRDESVPPSDADDYHAVLRERSRLHLVEGADHVFSSLAWTGQAIALSRDFLTQELGVTT